MANESGNTADPLNLEEELHARPYQFDFYQALRLLECRNKEKPGIGHADGVAGDFLRLSQEPTLAFQASSLASYTPKKAGLSELSVFFFGLFGPNGPLPLHLTEYARGRLRNHNDSSFEKLADIFHHRFLTLFYRAWAQTRPCVQYDRPETDRFSSFIGSLIGLGLDSLQNRTHISDRARFFFSGRLTSKARNAEGLQAILEGYFQVPVQIEEFVGKWLDLPDDSLWKLGGPEETGSLGTTALLGEKVWDIQNKFRIIFGPMTVSELNRFLPGEKSLSGLTLLVREYTLDELEWDLKLLITNTDISP
ncbi:MAG: type VI secretion system baseplate subunit TssG, partial [Nitrospinota bacterium]